MNCSKCQSDRTIKYGHTHDGKQRFQCLECRRQFVENASRQPIDETTTRNLIDRLLLERLALAAIARVTGVSERWLQMYVNQKYYQTPQQVEVTKKTARLTIQLDEMWSFVGSKDNKQWIWLALDANTREIVGVCVGNRSRRSAKKLWQSLPPVYRQCVVCYTDFWSADEQVLPSKRHPCCGQRNW